MIRTMKGGKSYSQINARSTKPSCKRVQFDKWYISPDALLFKSKIMLKAMKNDIKIGDRSLSYHYPYGDGDCIYLHIRELSDLHKIDIKYHERH